ncbi:Protein dom-3 [Aphelenchoides avenae]|nr:Protein dom-3 [Aphelenchus avenae]
MQPPPQVLSATPEEHQQGVDLQGAPVHVADMSWLPVEPFLTMSTESARRSAVKPLRRTAEEPKCRAFDLHPDMAEAFDAYIPLDKNRSASEAISAWIAWTLNAEVDPNAVNGAAPTMQSITNNADVIADSALLATIAATAYADDASEEWSIAAFRVGETMFLFDADWRKPFSEAERLDAFQREKFCRIMTLQGYDPSAPINANESFHRVLSCELGSSRGAFRILYTAQTDAIDRKGNPVMMRMEQEDEAHDEKWHHKKALSWYLESRFAAAKEIYVGELDDEGKLVGFAQSPVEWFAEEAKVLQAWSANVAFAALYNVLKEFREALQVLEEGRVITAKFVREKRLIQLERDEELDGLIPLSADFYQAFVEEPSDL